MSYQSIDINSDNIIFDKEKTKEYRTDFNKPCSCQDCRNFYKHIENNSELIDFLSIFGIDYTCTEEVFSWDWENDKDSLIHHEGYYGVFGKIDGEEFDIEKYGVNISFQKGASVPCDRTGEFFWICVSGDFPYILEEEREMPPCPAGEKISNKINGVVNTSSPLERIIAWIIDWYISCVPCLLLAFTLRFTASATMRQSITFIWILLLLILAIFASFVLRDVIFKGRSIGKRIFGLHITDKSTGNPASVGQRIIRNLFLFVYPLDGIILLSENESIGDKVAKTAVVKK